MMTILTVLSLLGSPTSTEIARVEKELQQLMEISDHQGRYDELRGLELSLPDEKFSDLHLKVFIQFLTKPQKVGTISWSSYPIDSLAILKSYDQHGWLSAELKNDYLLVLKKISRKRTKLVLKAQAKELLTSNVTLVTLTKRFAMDCAHLLNKMRIVFFYKQPNDD